MDILSIMNHLERSFKSVCKAIEYCSRMYENVCLPIKPSFYFDFVVQQKSALLKYKVIYCECQSPKGEFVMNIRKSSNRGKKEVFNSSQCDYIYADCPSGSYVIPSSEIVQKRAITLSMFEKFKI